MGVTLPLYMQWGLEYSTMKFGHETVGTQYLTSSSNVFRSRLNTFSDFFLGGGRINVCLFCSFKYELPQISKIKQISHLIKTEYNYCYLYLILLLFFSAVNISNINIILYIFSTSIKYFEIYSWLILISTAVSSYFSTIVDSCFCEKKTQ